VTVAHRPRASSVPRSRRRSRAARTHAERTAETVAKVKAATIEAIADLGFRGATTAEIARRAGVTWGAVQHHFADKTGILVAVLEDSAVAFMELLDGIEVEGVSLQKRVDRFVDTAWEHFSSDSHRSAAEILANLANPATLPAHSEGLPAGVAIVQLDRWLATWECLFHDAPLATAQSMALQGYVVATLSGLSSLRPLEKEGAETRRHQLGYLKDTLTRELTAARRNARN
jgi:AcrR family transcriptional regulator